MTVKPVVCALRQSKGKASKMEKTGSEYGLRAECVLKDDGLIPGLPMPSATGALYITRPCGRLHAVTAFYTDFLGMGMRNQSQL